MADVGREGLRPVLYGVSVGPGDPELICCRAVRAIREADVVAVPETESGRLAEHIAEPHLEGKRILRLHLPMGAPGEVRAQAYATMAAQVACELERGHAVAYLCLGDASTYSSLPGLVEALKAMSVRFDVEVIPGVTSYAAAAARAQVPLARGDGRLLVLPATEALRDERVLASADTCAVMKVGSHMAELREAITRLGLDEATCVAERMGLEGERLHVRATDATHVSYLSLAIVRARDAGRQPDE